VRGAAVRGDSTQQLERRQTTLIVGSEAVQFTQRTGREAVPRVRSKCHSRLCAYSNRQKQNWYVLSDGNDATK